MKYYNFNPFDKEIKKIEDSDLAVLTDVYEGWYIDYKQELIDLKKIAKHLSAFANQYGGWLFFGIEESDEQTAGSFLGIEKEKVRNLITAVREAATAHSNPEVYYEKKIIYGPSETIDLPENRAICIFYIPEGANPPYVHSSGKIYRRVSDQSDPKPETDRFILDRLWRKSQKNKERLQEFLRIKTDYSIDNPIAYIHLLTDRYFEREFRALKFEEFRETLTKTQAGGVSIPMNTFYSARGGYVARQTKKNKPLFPVVSFRWWQSGSALLTIPLNCYDTIGLMKRYCKSEAAHKFVREAEKQELADAKICDLNYFLYTVAGMYNQYRQLTKITSNNEDVYATISIANTFHVLTFLNDPNFVIRISELGIPLVEDKKIKIPEIIDPVSLINIKENALEIEGNYDVSKKESIHAVLGALSLVAPVLYSFGGLNEPDEILKFRSIFDTKMGFESK